MPAKSGLTERDDLVGIKKEKLGFSGSLGFFGIARDDIARGIHQSCDVTIVVPDGCFPIPEEICRGIISNSCSDRDFGPCFETEIRDGVSVVLRILQSPAGKIRIRSAVIGDFHPFPIQIFLLRAGSYEIGVGYGDLADLCCCSLPDLVPSQGTGRRGRRSVSLQIFDYSSLFLLYISHLIFVCFVLS